MHQRVRLSGYHEIRGEEMRGCQSSGLRWPCTCFQVQGTALSSLVTTCHSSVIVSHCHSITALSSLVTTCHSSVIVSQCHSITALSSLVTTFRVQVITGHRCPGAASQGNLRHFKFHQLHKQRWREIVRAQVDVLLQTVNIPCFVATSLFVAISHSFWVPVPGNIGPQ